MKEELQNKLYADFPDLFQETKLDQTQTCMCWGLECCDGWEPIIRNMCVLLSYRKGGNAAKKPPFPLAFKLENALSGVFRWLEKKLNKPYGAIRLTKGHRFDAFPGWEVRFTQIKEKFGTLRVYYDIYPKFNQDAVLDFEESGIEAAYNRYRGYVDGVISWAEYLSGRTCERDGSPGRLTRKGWWRTLCESCDKPSE